MPGRIELPRGWRRVAAHGPRPFVTREVLLAADGTVREWTSREHRRTRAGGGRRGTWWRPDLLGWWMGVLFAIGSSCFLVAAVASLWSSVSRPGLGITYFTGSLFFTTAAALQLHEAVDVEPAAERAPATRERRRRWWSWEPHRIDWLAAVVQLAGTLFFNISTFLALERGLDTRQANLRVWAPDAAGSICFLVSSELAYAEVCHRWACVRPRGLSWWIAALNLIGSIAFGVSAVAALIQPSTNEPVSAALADAGTAVGALCFLLGGLLLLPETARLALPTPRSPAVAPASA